jgi:hypothetical protein
MSSPAHGHRTVLRAFAALCVVLLFTWGDCPCATARAIRSSLAGDAPAAGCCCGCDDAAPDSRPSEEEPSRPDCPTCVASGCHGALATPDAPAALDVASAVAVAPPVAALAPVSVPPRAVRVDASGAPPPETGVETIVLRI